MQCNGVFQSFSYPIPHCNMLVGWGFFNLTLLEVCHVSGYPLHRRTVSVLLVSATRIGHNNRPVLSRPRQVRAKPVRLKCLRNQVLVDGLSYDDAATINKIEMVLVPVQLKNGSMGEKQQAIGYYQGRRVVRDGYAYGFVKDGKTLERWHYA